MVVALVPESGESGPEPQRSGEDGLQCQLCTSEPEIRYPASGRTVWEIGSKLGLASDLPNSPVLLLPAANSVEGGDGRDVPSVIQGEREVKMDAGSKKEGKSFLFCS